LTPITDSVSRQVRAQYEAHPYPRWINMWLDKSVKQSLAMSIRGQAPDFDMASWPARPRVLVAGCGTGLHPLTLAARHPECEITAIDLSLASLAYATRKQQEFGITNVTFGHADLAALDTGLEPFDFIDAVGVLHHMNAPLDGWRRLRGLLKPTGIMRIGLYSAKARRLVVRARELIADRKLPSTNEAIRAFRQAILEEPDLEQLQALAGWADFFRMGDFRDLIFHVQEHRFEIPDLVAALDALALEFGGFSIRARTTVQEFRKINPDPAAWLDLDRWHRFEQDHPDTFRAMYQFYCLPR
jgi:SAM-dependent methyltransferase